MNESLERLLEDEVGGFGFRLYDWSLRPAGRRRILQIYLYSEQGVGLDDCAKVSRRLGALIEEGDLIEGAYLLEVSSPGLDRSLKRLWHFELCVGKQVQLVYEDEIDQGKILRGIVQGVEGDEVLLDSGEGIARLRFDSISRARMIAEVTMKRKD